MHLVMLLDDKNIQNKVETDVSNLIDIGVVSVHSVEDLLGLLNIISDIEVIVFDKNYKTALLDMIKEKKILFDLLYIGEDEFKDTQLNIHCFKANDNIGEYLRGNKVHPNKRFNIIDDKELYYPVLSDTLKVMKMTPVDVFLRMRKDEYFHYIKFVHGGAGLGESALDKLDKVEKVFIKKEDKTLFFEHMNKIFISLLGNVKEPEKVSVKEEIFKQLISVGLNDKQIKVAEATINNVVESLKGGTLKEIKSILQAETSMNFRKSYMTSILCTALAKEINWVSTENKSALILSSYFNDRELVRDSMQFIITDYGVEVSDYIPDEKKAIREHAARAADWVAVQKNIPMEVERIIRQHHGSPSGVGFHTELSSQITKLTMVFMIAEEFAMEIIKQKDKTLSVKETLEEINNKYKNKIIKEILEALFRALKK